MSRVARKPLIIPKGVEFKLNGSQIHVKGKHGAVDFVLSEAVSAEVKEDQVFITPAKGHHPMVGTTHRLLGNILHGVSKLFRRKLKLVGVGYRAKVQGKNLELNVGYSNPVNFEIPDEVTIETPSNTEIIVKGVRKENVGQVAARIRSVRPPENYKGKGIRFVDDDSEEGTGGGGEVVILKQAKKKK